MIDLDKELATSMLDTALEQAQKSYDEGGVPVGGALFSLDGALLGKGHNKRVQEDNPAVHGETDAFINAGRQSDYRKTVMVTTLAPCLFCTGLIRQFNIKTVVVGESKNFPGALDELRQHGVNVIELNDQRCIELMGRFIEERPDIWNEDIGVAD
jgi:cytosine/creatinine deaminase